MTRENLLTMAVAAAVLTALTTVPADTAGAAGRLDALWGASDADTRPNDASATDTPSGTPGVDDPAEGKGGDADTDRGLTDKTEGKKPGPGSLFHGQKPSDTTGLLGHSLAAVLVILVLGAAAVFVIKRLLPRLGVSHGRRVSVLETVYLGPRKSLYVVQVGDRTLLVSGTRERLGLLADVTGSVPPAEETGSPPTAPLPSRTRFRIPGLYPTTDSAGENP